MPHRRALITIAACFGLGLGLAHTVSLAHACSCDSPPWALALDAIEGDGDIATEQAFWPADAKLSISGYIRLRLVLGDETELILERVQ